MSSPSRSLRSPTKRLRIMTSDEEREPSMHDQNLELKTRIKQLERELLDVKAENRTLSIADEQLTDKYYNLKEDDKRHRQRDSRVIKELNHNLARLQASSSTSAELKATVADQATSEVQLLDRFAHAIERTLTDVNDEADKGEQLECPVCMDEVGLKKCSLFRCGHYLCSGCLKELENSGIMLACPSCRELADSSDILREGLLNFDDGWDKLIKLATQWRSMGTSEPETSYQPIWHDSDASPEPVNQDEYQSTDHESAHEPVEDPVTPEESEEETSPTTPVTPSSARKKKLEELAARRSARRR